MNNEEIKIRKIYNSVSLNKNEEAVIQECYMNGINHDGHVWITWTDVEKIVCVLKGESI